jgi:hypothetical protein
LSLPSFTITSVYDDYRDLYCVDVPLVGRRERRNLNPRRRQCRRRVRRAAQTLSRRDSHMLRSYCVPDCVSVR